MDEVLAEENSNFIFNEVADHHPLTAPRNVTLDVPVNVVIGPGTVRRVRVEAGSEADEMLRRRLTNGEAQHLNFHDGHNQVTGYVRVVRSHAEPADSPDSTIIVYTLRGEISQ